MKILGGLGSGGLGFVVANLMCMPRSINAPIRFYIDTGCSKTTIGQVDAQRIGINYNLLSKSTVPTFTANGPVFPDILPNCGILFNLFGTSLVEYVGDVYVVSTNPISLLGLDVLKKFSIHFVQNSIVLER